MDGLYQYTLADLKKIINDDKTVTDIFNDINFCELMCQLRFPIYDANDDYVKELKANQ